MSAFQAAPHLKSHRMGGYVVLVLSALIALAVTVAFSTSLNTSAASRVVAAPGVISHPARAGAAALVQSGAVRYIPQEKAVSAPASVSTAGGVYSRQDKSYSPAQ